MKILKAHKPYIVWGILTALLLYAAWPLLTSGFIPTHDGEYHIIRIWQFSKMLASGNWFPRWAPDLNSGYGLPLFNFHYPFPDYIGSFWHGIGFRLADSVKLTLFTGYAGAVVFANLWLSTMFPPLTSLIGTVVYMFVPYWFVNLYVRGSVGEVLAMTWVMMCLYAVEKKRIRLAAVAMGLLIVTHNITAMMFAPVLTLYLLLRRLRMWPAVGVGVGLAAYFWIPAIFERRFVTGLNTVNYRDYFPPLYRLLVPSWGTGFQGGVGGDTVMSPQIGIIPLVVYGIAVILAMRGVWRKRLVKRGVFWGIIAVTAVFMMLRISEPVWQVFMFLAFIQYPWRILSFLTITAGFFGAFVARRLPRWIGIGLAALAVMVTTQYVRPVKYEVRNDAYYLSRRNFTDGTSSLGNAFTTKWSPWKDSRARSRMEVIHGDAKLSRITRAGTTVSADAEVKENAVVQVNTLYYPGWRVTIDGTPTEMRHENGVLQVDVPAGSHRIIAHFGETMLRTVANCVSVISLLYVIFLTPYSFPKRRQKPLS